MKTIVRPWGNSLGIRIPKAVAAQAGLKPGDTVKITVQGSQIILTPAGVESYSLDELLADVTPENRHDEVNFGPATGNEFW